MLKAEMEADAVEYHALMDQAEAAEAQGLYKVAVAHARAAWKCIDGLMQHQKKYGEREVQRLRALEMVLKYAPLLLDYRSLEAAEELLTTCKRIGRTLGDTPIEMLTTARARLQDNHRLWTHIEKGGEVRKGQLCDRLGGRQEDWRNVIESWTIMGLVASEPDGQTERLSFTTRLGQVVPAKCPKCGEISEGPKSMFFERMRCPECGAKVSFVLVAPVENPQTRES